MQTLRIKFIDFYSGFDAQNCFEMTILKKHYTIEIVAENPDFIISGCYDKTHLDYDTAKIFFTVEDLAIHPEYADIVLGADVTGKTKEFHYLGVVGYEHYDALLQHNTRPSIYTPQKNKFCAFMYHNDAPDVRKIFCQKLMKYKQVDCLGRVLRNTDLIVPKDAGDAINWKKEQLHIYNDYKFTIAFENICTTNTVSEKILQPLLVGSIPIYWGVENINDYFNPDCFISVNDFNSFEQCIAHIKKVDNDPDLYQKYLNAPPILPTSKLHHITSDKMADWLHQRIQNLIDNPHIKIGKISAQKKQHFIKWHRQRYKKMRWNMLLLKGAKMPHWQKAYYIYKGIYAIIRRKIKRL